MNYSITICSSDSCRFCIKLKKWLDESGISYINKDVNDKDVLEEFNNYNVNAIPFTIIFDENSRKEEKITGFNPEKIMNILENLI
ncbi:glutaredoxin family protein [Virgibacillus sp. AGTR]|uniref:glutaredoxin family protein n=1 Tax=Virgibacillus sp. AGTR TaxID=2812055 RepID=UPI001D168390|nr:glutaredoxin family protein [Virgibacillus sp. AGTR]MCC2248967.1 glutaredoxin family protein [Virgibacillus sp. AGTR]